MIIALVGSNGKMGTAITKIANDRHHTIIPIDVGNSYENIKCDSVIDFSTPTAINTSLAIASRNNCPLISGVTGYNYQQQQLIEQAKKTITIITKSNFSQGINAIGTTLPTLLNSLNNWHCELTETHHKNKIDAPSGTALSLAKIIVDNGFNCPITPIRDDNTIGVHTLKLTSYDEEIIITHKAYSRNIFALGAVLTAENEHNKRTT